MSKSHVHASILFEGQSMAQSDTRSLQELKREAEQTRAGLTQTVEQLRSSVAETAHDIRERASPAAIKAEVSSYIRSRGEQLLEEMTIAARKNPLQAVAVGATVAYPLLRMARTIPAPVLMLGAGLFLAGSKTGRAATQKASDIASDLSDEAMRRSREFRDQMDDSASAARAYASEKLGDFTEAVSNTADRVSRAAGEAGPAVSSGPGQLQAVAETVGASVTERAAQAREDGSRMFESATRTVKEAAADVAASGQNALGNAKEGGLQAARAMREKASDLADHTGTTLLQTIERNPLLVAGVGLLVGGLIASALPRSDIEDEVVGGTASAVKRRAQAAASEGLEAAKQAAAGAYDEGTKQAAAEGLDPEGLNRAARDVGHRVRRVAEAAVTTAFEPTHEKHSQSALGDNNNG
jgi:hypothetical protein